jgi:CHAT domain-containing protein/tetratricopeptide (TPR) repeat protein
MVSMISRGRLIRYGVMFGAAGAVLFWTVRTRQTKSTEELLSVAYTQQRTVELRIPDAVHSAMREERSEHLHSRLDRPPALLLAEAQIAEALRDVPASPSILKLKARADLLSWNYQDAIQTLKYALEDMPDSSDMQLDLATAYFERAEANDQPSDYGEAVELLGRILQNQPNNETALFNRGLVFEKLVLYRQAVRDWDSYLRLDSSSAWAVELRERRDALEEKVRERGRSGDEIRIAPEEYLKIMSHREATASGLDSQFDDQIYQDSALLDWLPAAYPLRTPTARESQSQAQAALVSLATDLNSVHHDGMLVDLLRHASARGFATAVQKLRDAIEDEREGRPEAARDAASAALQLFEDGGNPAGSFRAQFEVVYSQHLLLAPARCRRSAAVLRNRAIRSSYQWIAIQSALEESACLDSLGDPGAATRLVNEAIDAAKRTNYWTLYLRGVATEEWLLSDAGETSEAWRVTRLGLKQYWSRVFPPMRGYSLYYQAGYIAESLHEWYLFFAFAQESLDSIAGTKDLELEAIARRRLAMAAARSGHTDVARQEFQRSTMLIEEAPPSAITDETATENTSEIVRLEAGTDLAHARQLLDEIRASESAFQDRTVALSYFEAAAAIALREGRSDEGYRKSLAAVTIAERIAGTLSTAQQKLGWVEQTRDAYLGLVQANLARHDTNMAFAVWERYRSIPFVRTPPRPLVSVPSSDYRELDSVLELPLNLEATPRFSLPDGNLVLSYARFAGGIQIWTIDRSGVSSAWVAVPPDVLQRVSDRFVRECSDPTSNRHALERDAKQLYLWLITPHESRIRGAPFLTIEPDISFEEVPFSALISSDGKYLGEEHSVVVSIDTALGLPSNPKSSITRNSSALVVGAPASFEPGLAQLPDAESEAANVARQFRSVVLATGANATRALVSRSLPRVEVFHFAGHTVIKNGEAGLLLASETGAGQGSAFLTADDISRTEIKYCQLAVLSACSTARQDEAMPLDRHGLVSSFLYSGVRHVIASEWDVDSTATAELMKRFYPNLLAGMTSAQALQKAGAEIRKNPITSHPYYWAAFQAFGKP